MGALINAMKLGKHFCGFWGGHFVRPKIPIGPTSEIRWWFGTALFWTDTRKLLPLGIPLAIPALVVIVAPMRIDTRSKTAKTKDFPPLLAWGPLLCPVSNVGGGGFWELIMTIYTMKLDNGELFEIPESLGKIAELLAKRSGESVGAVLNNVLNNTLKEALASPDELMAGIEADERYCEAEGLHPEQFRRASLEAVCKAQLKQLKAGDLLK